MHNPTCKYHASRVFATANAKSMDGLWYTKAMFQTQQVYLRGRQLAASMNAWYINIGLIVVGKTERIAGGHEQFLK